MSIINTISILLLLFNIVVLFFAILIIKKKGGIKFLKLFISRKVKPKQKVDSVSDELNKFAAYKATGKDTIFIGDSILAGGSWFEFYPELSCRNRAIGGSTTSDIVSRIDSVIQSKPKKIILLMGINDLLLKESKEKIINNYKNVLNTIKNVSLDTEVFVCGVLPINRKKCEEILAPKKSFVIDIKNEDIKETNILIKNLCEEMGITYIESEQGSTDEFGELKESYTYDGLHLTFEGYMNLSENVRPFIYQGNKSEVAV
ncbi:GDSL-type esterase/lipase family protein [Bacillus cereus group sp. BceL293]|uniref:GDSL-type esterase/lipase family protein n=1 Tax=Bacillus cereus group sp. BceL293 TaxID=3444992 RepID=UPI002962D9B5|nr:hypothetical protein [Bacillus cereus]